MYLVWRQYNAKTYTEHVVTLASRHTLQLTREDIPEEFSLSRIVKLAMTLFSFITTNVHWRLWMLSHMLASSASDYV